MSDDFLDFFFWVRNAYTLSTLEKVAQVLDSWSAKADNTRRWLSNFNLAGLIGEQIYAWETGLIFDPWIKVRRGHLNDGGEDFPGVDVKGTTLHPPRLMHPRPAGLRARFYALVSVDPDLDLEGEYLGYATAETLDASEDRDFGHGPTRTLYPHQLTPGLPPV